jgi:lipoprotein-releasing system permease protein
VYQALLTRKYLTSKIMPLLAIAAVVLCTWIVLITWSVMGGFLVMLLELGRRMEADVSINWPTIGFAHYEDLMQRLERDPLVAGAAPMIDSFGLINLPDGRVSGVRVRGIDARYQSVSDWSESLWWKPIDEPMPKDKGRTDPRLDPNWPEETDRFLADRSRMQATPSIRGGTYRPPAPGAIRSWDQTFRDGLRMKVTGPDGMPKPAVVPGIELSDFARRAPLTGVYEVDALVAMRLPAGDVLWQSNYLPSHKVTINVLPLDEKGRNFTVVPRTLPVANEFRTGFFEADKNAVFMELGELQSMLRMDAGEKLEPAQGDPYDIEIGPDGRERVRTRQVIRVTPPRVTKVLVKGKPGVTPEQLQLRAIAVYEEFARAHDGQVPTPEQMEKTKGIQTWEMSQATFIGAVKNETVLVLFLLIGLSVVASVLILAIFWSMVSEKTRDIGVLRAVGCSKVGVAWLWLRYGLAIGVAGGVLGGLAACLTIWNINPIHEWMGEALGIAIWDPKVYYFATIPNKVELGKLLLVVGGSIVFSVLGALIPAIRASRMDPVRALRFE